MPDRPYRGRIAPSPTGYLHRGHARTFQTAHQRARLHHGALILRIEDLDRERCKTPFEASLIEDLRWVGLEWDEGPDIGGPHAPYRQTERLAVYRKALASLAAQGQIYPCRCTRRDAAHALGAPHADELQPTQNDPCRPMQSVAWTEVLPTGVNWRFWAPASETVRFDDGCAGPQQYISGTDFGDFIVWRKDGYPAYQLAVVIDDAAMAVTEVVRGADLLASTAQQILLYRALGFAPPSFYHCPLVTNPDGTRLAKRSGAHSLREMRLAGVNPESLRRP